MKLNSAKCRSEQARHLEWSLNDLLTNRRIVVARAAEAWGLEALRAEEREAKKPARLSKVDAEIARIFAEEANAETKSFAIRTTLPRQEHHSLKLGSDVFRLSFLHSKSIKLRPQVARFSVS